MKLRVLLLGFVLAIGLFFSSLSVKPTYAAIDLGKIIKEVGDLIAGIVREKEDQKEINKMSVDTTTAHNTMAVALLQITGSEEAGIIGAIPSTGKAIAAIYKNSPASGQTYVADLMQNMKIGPAQPAYAQVGGLGFAALEPILYAWKQFRNIAYMFFIVITLIIGFMIMMRQKIGGQAAVTAQQAIPNIVVALITVTFSYAIAGFMIDLMYVFMYLMVGLFPDPVSGQTDPSLVTKNILEIGLAMFSGGIGTAFTAVEEFVTQTLGGEGAAEIAGLVAGLTFAIIIAFAYLFAVVGLFFELLKTYIAIIVNIVMAPLLLMLGALPGRSDVFKDWIKSVLGNLVAFPVVLLLIILHRLMTSGPSAEGGFLPPYLMGRGSGSAITAMVGLAVMLIAKDLVIQAKKSVNPKGSGIFEQFGSALSQAVSKGWKGGEIIPGVGLSDTNKMPLVGKYLGSGQKAASLGAVGIAGGIGAVGGGAWDLGMRRRQMGAGAPELQGEVGRGKVRNVIGRRFVDSARGAANTLGYEPLKNAGKKGDSKDKK